MSLSDEEVRGGDSMGQYEGRREANSDERRHYVEPIHKWRWRLLTIWIVVFTLATIYALHQISNTRVKTREQIAEAIYENCHSTAVLLTQLIQPGIKNTAKISYYDSHPAERAQVIAQIHDSLRRASAHRCDTLPSNKYRKDK